MTAFPFLDSFLHQADYNFWEHLPGLRRRQDITGAQVPSQIRQRHFLGMAHDDRSRVRSEEHTSELQSHSDLVCRLLLEKKKKNMNIHELSRECAATPST